MADEFLTAEEIKAQQYARTALVLYRCKACKRDKPGHDFYPALDRRNGRNTTRCKACTSLYNKERRKSNTIDYAKFRELRRAEYEEHEKDLFVCGTCEEVKPGGEFPFHIEHQYGVCASRCKACSAKRVREWRATRKAIIESVKGLGVDNTGKP